MKLNTEWTALCDKYLYEMYRHNSTANISSNCGYCGVTYTKSPYQKIEDGVIPSINQSDCNTFEKIKCSITHCYECLGLPDRCVDCILNVYSHLPYTKSRSMHNNVY